MIDAVDQALAQREHLDTGFWRGTGTSIVMHVGVAAVLLFGLRPQTARLIPATPSVSSLPVGEILGIPVPDRGSSLQSDATVLKPPTAASHRAAKGLPSSTQRTLAMTPVEPIQAVSSTGTGGELPLVLGDPNGVTSANSWYLAGVQAKVWAVWASEMRPDFVTPVEVQFTILEDGSLADPQVVARSGSFVIDLAATRAIVSAAPFAPLPKSIEAKAITIRAHFKPDR